MYSYYSVIKIVRHQRKTIYSCVCMYVCMYVEQCFEQAEDKTILTLFFSFYLRDWSEFCYSGYNHQRQVLGNHRCMLSSFMVPLITY
jgi:hypothetical protein